MKYLFMDFDGVLHGDEFNTNYFQHSIMFCDRLTPYKHLFRIVISSSWREMHSFEKCANAFKPSLTDIVVGITPIHADGFNYHGRYNEISEYCYHHNIKDHEWMAIDDMAILFPENCKNLILTNTLVGITPRVLDKVEEWILS